MKDVAFLLAGGEIFALVVYAQLILENAPIYRSPTSCSIRSSTSWCATCRSSALQLLSQPSSTEQQMACCRRMIQKAVHDPERYDRVWREQVAPLSGGVRDESVAERARKYRSHGSASGDGHTTTRPAATAARRRSR